MDILNNREWALVIWFFVFIIFVLSSPKMKQVRALSIQILKAFFVKIIITTFCLMIFYITIVVWGLFKIGLWESYQLKNTIIWAISVGALSLFNINTITNDPHFFKKSVLDNIKLVAIVQFVVEVYTFSLLVELLLVPVFIVLGAMLALAQTDEKYHLVEKILNGIMVALGVIFIDRVPKFL